MLFADIPGLSAVKEQLIRSAQSGRVSHAQLFLGKEGGGHLALALAYATYLNCKQPGPTDSCGVCESCVKYNKLIHPDLHFSFPIIRTEKDKSETISDVYIKPWRSIWQQTPFFTPNEWLNKIGAENKQGNISVSECQNIIRKLSLSAFEAPYKVLIMWQPELLGNTGNVLLKIVEDPPPNTLFLFVAEDEERILTTIRSRLLMVKIPRISTPDLTRWLVENQSLAEEQAHSLALVSEGNIAQANRLLKEEVDLNEQLFTDWMRKCFLKENARDLSQWVEIVAGLGREKQKNLLNYSLHMLRECLMYRYGTPEHVNLIGSELEFVKKFSPFIDHKKLNVMARSIEQSIFYIERNVNSKLIFHTLSFDIERQLKGGTPQA